MGEKYAGASLSSCSNMFLSGVQLHVNSLYCRCAIRAPANSQMNYPASFCSAQEQILWMFISWYLVVHFMFWKSPAINGWEELKSEEQLFLCFFMNRVEPHFAFCALELWQLNEMHQNIRLFLWLFVSSLVVDRRMWMVSIF